MSGREDLERVVREGGVVLFGADTLYGLGCDPSNPDAIDRIHEIKGRGENKPSAVLFFSPLAMREVLANAGARTRSAIGALLPGPVTLVIDNSARLYPLACGATPEHLGIRLIEGPLAGAGVALFQTSANRSGEPAPRRLEDVDTEIAAAADLAIDCGPARGEGSTVIDISRIDEDPGGWTILRPGPLSKEKAAALLASAP